MPDLPQAGFDPATSSGLIALALSFLTGAVMGFAARLLVAVAETMLPMIGLTASLGLTQVDPEQKGGLDPVLLLPFMPALLLSLSAFTRVAVVFFLLRQGLGKQYVPPNLVLIGLALLLTYFVMHPVTEKIHAEAYEPYGKGQLAALDAREKAGDAMKGFMLRQTRADDLSIFMPEGSKVDLKKPESVPFHALAPAFITSELKTAFKIGFMVILPFLIIDLVVASVLTGMGMIMVPPLLGAWMGGHMVEFVREVLVGFPGLVEWIALMACTDK